MTKSVHIVGAAADAKRTVADEPTARPVRTSWKPPAFVPVIVALALVCSYFGIWGGAYSLYVVDSILLASVGAMALNMLMGAAGQISIGNVAFLVVGGFTAVFCARAGIPFPLDLIVAMLVGGLVGVIVGLPALRVGGLYLALSTLAAHFVALYLAQEYQSHTVGSGGFSIAPLFASYGLTGGARDWLWLLLVLVAISVYVCARIRDGKLGRALHLLRDHPEVAASFGISVTRYKLVTFCVSSAVISLQGALAYHFAGAISYEQFSFNLAVSYVAMITIGGLDTLIGPLLGAAVVAGLPLVLPNILTAHLRGTLANDAPQLSQALYGLLILLAVASPRLNLASLLSSAGALLQRVWTLLTGRLFRTEPTL